jgi:hypothetical protein
LRKSSQQQMQELTIVKRPNITSLNLSKFAEKLWRKREQQIKQLQVRNWKLMKKNQRIQHTVESLEDNNEQLNKKVQELLHNVVSLVNHTVSYLINDRKMKNTVN